MMLTPEERQILDDTVQKLALCGELDHVALMDVVTEFQERVNRLPPDSELKNFFDGINNAMYRYAGFDDEEWYNSKETNAIEEAADELIIARAQLTEENRPDFVPTSLAKAYDCAISKLFFDKVSSFVDKVLFD